MRDPYQVPREKLKPSERVETLPKGSWCYDSAGVKHLCSLDPRTPNYVTVSTLKSKMSDTGKTIEVADQMKLWPEDMFNETFEVR